MKNIVECYMTLSSRTKSKNPPNELRKSQEINLDLIELEVRLGNALNCHVSSSHGGTTEDDGYHLHCPLAKLAAFIVLGDETQVVVANVLRSDSDDDLTKPRGNLVGREVDSLQNLYGAGGVESLPKVGLAKKAKWSFIKRDQPCINLVCSTD